MLLAVEGGGFFSSSASGYSKGLTLLLLGRGTEERPMRVSPWNQYQLVEPGPDFQLASKKNGSSGGCASFMCFGRASIKDGPSPPKVGPAHRPVIFRDQSDIVDEENENGKRLYIKSNLKKSSSCPASVGGSGHDLCGVGKGSERRVQWTDVCGGELVEIREFEVSSSCAPEEDFKDKHSSCGCMIQ